MKVVLIRGEFVKLYENFVEVVSYSWVPGVVPTLCGSGIKVEFCVIPWHGVAHVKTKDSVEGDRIAKLKWFLNEDADA